MEHLLFQLLQVSIGIRDRLDRTPIPEEWFLLSELARKHTVVGLCWRALDRLPKEQWPPRDIVLSWSVMYRQIEMRNRRVDMAAAAVIKWFGLYGFRSCILKGQGNALAYPVPSARTPGDIDIWLEGGSRRILKFARQRNVNGKVCYHHIDWGKYNGVEVEVHYRPSFMCNPIHNSRLQSWFLKNADRQFSNAVNLPDGAGTVSVPDFSFNVVYQLSHLFNHFLQEGIGLRQFVDYYFLLTSNKQEILDKDWRCGIRRNLSYLGLHNFARAVMWVLSEVFLLEEDCQIVSPDESGGRLLLGEIMAGGNFGQHDQRILCGIQTSSLHHNIARFYRDIRLFCHFPSECLCEPLFRLWHSVWRAYH